MKLKKPITGLAAVAITGLSVGCSNAPEPEEPNYTASVPPWETAGATEDSDASAEGASNSQDGGSDGNLTRATAESDGTASDTTGGEESGESDESEAGDDGFPPLPDLGGPELTGEGGEEDGGDDDDDDASYS